MLCHLLICCGSLKEACSSHASFSWSSIPGTSVNSCHQSGMLCTLALQDTQLLKSSTGGSGEDLFLSFSSELPAGSWSKWFEALLIGWQRHPPVGPTEGGYVSSPHGSYVVPLSALALWCVGTSHGG